MSYWIYRKSKSRESRIRPVDPPLLFLPYILAIVVSSLSGCGRIGGGQEVTAPVRDEAALTRDRQRMVAQQIAARGIKDPLVLAAMKEVPRHRFMPEALRTQAYADSALPIGRGQTISQPYIVALMTELIQPKRGMKVLEIGTGSGYQAAVLAQCGAEVDTIEIIPELGRRAERTLRDLGYSRVRVRIGDGYHGWPEHAPFDAVILTAAPDQVPQPLLDQLRNGGRLVAPV